MKINYIHEPTDLQCGQAVLAMLIGTSAEAICQIIGNDRETTLREMKDTLRNFGFTVSDARVPVKCKHELPPLCMLSLETPRCWHWSLYCDGTFYDPEHGVMEDFPESNRRYYWKVTPPKNPRKIALLMGSKRDKILQCLKAAGWYEGRKIDISFIEKYYQSQNVQLTEGAKAFMQEFYGISEEWHFRKGVWYEFSLFPFRNVPDEFVYDYMYSFADNQKKAVEQIAGEYVVIVGEIGYYYPARIWFGSNNKIYTTHEYDEIVHVYDNIIDLILYDFEDEWEKAIMY